MLRYREILSGLSGNARILKSPGCRKLQFQQHKLRCKL
jgi:hypothetical protein